MQKVAGAVSEIVETEQRIKFFKCNYLACACLGTEFKTKSGFKKHERNGMHKKNAKRAKNYQQCKCFLVESFY